MVYKALCCQPCIGEYSVSDHNSPYAHVAAIVSPVSLPRSRSQKQLRKALPELPVDDVPAAVKYYCEVLGFHIN
jgi:hypothetical protein